MLRTTKLAAVKSLHTAVWLAMAVAVLAIPLLAVRGRFDWVARATGLVLLECLALSVNRGRCPLRTLAARYTDDRRDGFDIHLPPWLARNTVWIFGTAFVLGELVFFRLWLMRG
jgi:hypothetical protein